MIVLFEFWLNCVEPSTTQALAHCDAIGKRRPSITALWQSKRVPVAANLGVSEVTTHNSFSTRNL